METGDKEYNLFVRNRVRYALLIVVGLSLILVLIGQKAWGKGLALGGLFSIVHFLLLSRSVPAAVINRNRSGRSLAALWVVGRLLVLAAPLYLAATFEMFNLPATVIGLFVIQILLFLEPVVKRLLSSTGRGAKWKN